ncbi:GNAT family N-acetyltransferase [Micromonospora sp. NPDC049366]|uniref:GNAT family N-acetyltransferase n=1 Tax=Micromonospora sp. NPDC049366 TaxID=3364271 RepID=UPI0037AE38E1
MTDVSVRISQADEDDVTGLARLLWRDTLDEEPASTSADAFAVDVGQWWTAHRHTHVAYVARLRTPEIVGMAWVALLPRVPRPGATGRFSADLQSVFVLPEHRGQGIGSALVEAASEHATRLGAARVTVHSGRRAVPVYERLSFESSRQLLCRPARRLAVPPDGEPFLEPDRSARVASRSAGSARPDGHERP